MVVEMSEGKKMIKKIQEMSNDQLGSVWNALDRGWEKGEEYAPGISMTEWAEQVYSEKSRRGLN